MKIGVVGLGIVGKANLYGFKQLGHEVYGHDIKTDTKLSDLLVADVIFLCVPTPNTIDGSCDVAIVRSVLIELNELNYNGVCCVRSTVSPGSTELFQREFPNLRICFSPEFLRERCAIEDFISNQRLLVVGTTDELVYNLIVCAHGKLCAAHLKCKPSEAEIIKYYKNVYAATKVTFANMMYELTENLSSDYETIRSAFCTVSGEIPDYLFVKEDLRGFAGPCLPKDSIALSKTLVQNGITFSLINAMIEDNNSIPKTVLSGMRNE